MFFGFLVFAYKTENLFEHLSYILIWAILAFFTGGALFEIIKNKDKKGKIYQTYREYGEGELYSLDNIEGYKKIIQNENGFILINEAGIFEIRFIYGTGSLIGDIKDKTFKLNNKIIPNPFLLKDSIKYLVLTKNLLVTVSGVRLVTKTRLVFVLEKYLDKKIYTKEQIDKIYNEVQYGNN